MFHKHYNVYETVEAATSLSQERKQNNQVGRFSS